MKKTYIKPTFKTVVLKNRATLLAGSGPLHLNNSDANDDGDYYNDL